MVNFTGKNFETLLEEMTGLFVFQDRLRTPNRVKKGLYGRLASFKRVLVAVSPNIENRGNLNMSTTTCCA